MSRAAAVIEILKAFADSIRALGSVPSGELYARACGTMTLAQYNEIIGILKRAGLVREDGYHILTWTGPQQQEATL